MSQVLTLEYTCTKAEMEQAQSLSLRKQVGGGSKWRTWFVLLLVLAGMLGLLYFQIKDLAPVYRLLIFGGILVFSVCSVIGKRWFRRDPQAATRVEISSADFSILGPDSKVTILWSGFSECLESPDLFVLLDRPKTILIVVPKRAFPSESWQTWFRAQAEHRSSPLAPPPTLPPAVSVPGSADRITFTIQLGFRDYLDRTVASWKTWGIFMAVAALAVGMELYLAAHPAPGRVHSNTTGFFLVMVPCFLAMMVVVIPIVAFSTWRSHKKSLGPQEVALSEDTMFFTGSDGHSALPWTSYACYKETRWSFILWRGVLWIMFPKRSFRSPADVDRCRALLSKHLRRTRWFPG
jgi:hypothetical protein